MIWYVGVYWGFGVERNKRRDLIYGEICFSFFFLFFLLRREIWVFLGFEGRDVNCDVRMRNWG